MSQVPLEPILHPRLPSLDRTARHVNLEIRGRVLNLPRLT